jgi:hypothetical protein
MAPCVHTCPVFPLARPNRAGGGLPFEAPNTAHALAVGRMTLYEQLSARHNLSAAKRADLRRGTFASRKPESKKRVDGG